VHVAPADIVNVISAHVRGERPPAGLGLQDQIVWQLRAPRTVLALVCGAGLAICGAALQVVVRNALADPYVLGASAGASLGAAAAITLASAAFALVSVAAFAGALLALLLVLALGRRCGEVLPERLVLSGVGVAALLTAATSYLQYRANPEELAAVLFWLLGSLSGARWSQVLVPSAGVALGSAWTIARARALNALAVGDESAVTLGVAPDRLRLELVVVTGLITGCAMAVAGGIGFVGLIVPHAARALVGPDHRRMLPATAVLGGLLLALVDLAARTLQPPLELPLGVITAVIGAPVFLWLVRRRDAALA